MVKCVTCGVGLHPERAEKYDYCTARECQAANFKGLTMVAVGVNKSADQFQILDEQTRNEMADGKDRDQRRGSFGKPERRTRNVASAADLRVESVRSRPVPAPPRRRPWSRSQEKLALIYNERGMRPAEIAEKLGVSNYVASQIVLAAKNRKKS